MWSGRKELVMKWKLLLKEGAVAYLRVVSKHFLASVRKFMNYLAGL
jgi:hypothetical protein